MRRLCARRRRSASITERTQPTAPSWVVGGTSARESTPSANRQAPFAWRQRRLGRDAPHHGSLSRVTKRDTPRPESLRLDELHFLPQADPFQQPPPFSHQNRVDDEAIFIDQTELDEL